MTISALPIWDGPPKKRPKTTPPILTDFDQFSRILTDFSGYTFFPAKPFFVFFRVFCGKFCKVNVIVCCKVNEIIKVLLNLWQKCVIFVDLRVRDLSLVWPGLEMDRFWARIVDWY